MPDLLTDFTFRNDAAIQAPIMVHTCGWYCTITDNTLADIVLIAGKHVASQHKAGAR